jgi:hypothetical protein
MEFAFRATVLSLAVLSTSVAFAQGRPTTLAQFIGASKSGGHACCPAPACEPKCCPAPQPICEPKCCPAPVCEPKCCPPPSCGCESHDCRPACHSRGPRQYPLEALLGRMDRALCSTQSQCGKQNQCSTQTQCGKQTQCRKQNHCKPSDPCGYDLWPCLGQCCNTCPSGHGPAAPPATFDPGLLRPYDEKRIDPFQDDPLQPPRPPMSPSGVRGARLQPAIQIQRQIR